MLQVPNVVCAAIFDRRLGCADESARDDELADKILYYYPTSTSLRDQVNEFRCRLQWISQPVVLASQLTKVNMLEGLIEFSNKFSAFPLDQIVMRVRPLPDMCQ